MPPPSNQSISADQDCDPVYQLFPYIPSSPSELPSMAVSSLFGGPCVHGDGNSQFWSRCHLIYDDGQLETYQDPSELDVIRDVGESLQQAIARLNPYSLSACRLKVTSSNQGTELSGVWIKGLTRDVILTVSHFKKDTTKPTSASNTTAEAFTTMIGSTFSAVPIRCELFHDFDNPGGPRDFAIFTSCSGENSRSPAHSIPTTEIIPEAGSLSGIAISFGYNTILPEGKEKHPDPNIHNCNCTKCWYGSSNSVLQRLNANLSPPDPRLLLAPGLRSISVGQWIPAQDQQPCHTATGWYGTSGSGMYTRDGEGTIRLVALFQLEIFKGPDSEMNQAVVIPSDVCKRLDEAGVMKP
ncbi:hypothetical protein EV356DRAFT_511216 [Viridothelium virens]|uniref:Uncharacterized protein n=1 Tax=Viridothelium virens TaxID=1048519 RepID=A0A6A6HR50_VIRVR|nr:hypothetical protein EV356DRAFT_511216 [Viridothelium virens]